MACGASLSLIQAHGKTSFGSAMARIISFGPKGAKHLEAEVEHILSVF